MELGFPASSLSLQFLMPPQRHSPGPWGPSTEMWDGTPDGGNCPTWRSSHLCDWRCLPPGLECYFSDRLVRWPPVSGLQLLQPLYYAYRGKKKTTGMGTLPPPKWNRKQQEVPNSHASSFSRDIIWFKASEIKAQVTCAPLRHFRPFGKIICWFWAPLRVVTLRWKNDWARARWLLAHVHTLWAPQLFSYCPVMFETKGFFHFQMFISSFPLKADLHFCFHSQWSPPLF